MYMLKLFTSIGLLSVTIFSGEAAIAPYLPESAPSTPYFSTAIAPEQISVAMPDGAKLAPTSLTTTRSLNGQWRFSGVTNSANPFPDDADLAQGLMKEQFDDSRWDKIAVPLNWYVQYRKAQDATKPYTKGWYRQTFSLSQQDIKNHRVLLHFGVIGYAARLFINGQEAGRHHGDFTPWEVDITPLIKTGSNTIALRVFSDFGPVFGGPKNVVHVYGAQWSINSIKAGLWQDVELRLTPLIRIDRALVTPNLKKNSITVDYRIINQSGREATCELDAAVTSAIKADANRPNTVNRQGQIKVQPGTTDGQTEIKLQNPVKWTLENPYLYYLTLALRRDNGVITALPVRFGFRDFKTQGRNFYLNDERVYLFGENFPSSRYEGDGLTAENAVAKIAEQLTGYKALGYNIIRTAHAPTSPTLYRIADEIGLMVYDEWGWCFSKLLDEPAFEANNRQEITEWIQRDYNHPAVTMWSCGNEVVHKESEAVKRQLDKQVDLVRSLDRSGRPVGSFSGSASWKHYGQAKLNTDFLDLHHYLGLAAPAWTVWNDEFKEYYQMTSNTYAPQGGFNLPYIVWECVGFSWGTLSDANFKTNNINSYAEYANRKTNWGNPNGIGFAGSIGLAAALDPKRGLDYGKEVFGQRVLETIRQDDRIQGFAPWFHGSKLAMAKIWTQPVLCGLRDTAFVPPGNLFAGQTIKPILYTVNSTNKTIEHPVADIALVLENGQKGQIAEVKLPAIKPWEIVNHEISLSLPEQSVPLRGQLRVTMRDGEREISRNFYPVFIQEPKVMTQPVKATKTVAIWQNGNIKGTAQLTNILNALNIPYRQVAPGQPLNGIDVLIIPPALDNDQPVKFERAPLLAMAQQGATVVQLEQKVGMPSLLGENLTSGNPNTYVDLVLTGHPVFAGLNQSNFDTWRNPDHGFIIKAALGPFTGNALAVLGPFLGQRQVSNAVMEALLGKGRIFCSQLEATKLWGHDSAATTYMRNLLNYLTTNAPIYPGVTAYNTTSQQKYTTVPENLEPIDLAPYANRSFSDEQPGDGKGGWTDQGKNDFRQMPLGRQMAAGVLFNIIDPAKNNDKSCLILRGSDRPQFPAAITGIKVGRKFARLFFLHACAWGKGAETGRYVIHYADGTQSSCLLEDGRNIGDWWNCAGLPQAPLGIVRNSADGRQIGLGVAVWENPFPDKEIATIDFMSAGSDRQVDYLPGHSAVPILAAITGEKCHPSPLPLTDAWRGANSVKTGEKPQLQNLGNGAVKVVMPAPKNSEFPAMMTKFSPEALVNGKYHYLTFRIKAATAPARLDIVLPQKSWQTTRLYTLNIDAGFLQWTKVRLHLNDDLKTQGREFLDSSLRGELFIYNGHAQATISNYPAIQFELDNIRLE